MERESGFYWVSTLGEWFVAEYFVGVEEVGTWFMAGSSMNYGDDHFSEIGERIERKESE